MHLFVVMVAAVVALALAVVSGWILRPARVTKPVLVALTLVLLLACLGLAVVSERSSSTPKAGPSAQPGPTLPTSVRTAVILYVDQAAGYPVLFSIRGDGTSRQRLWNVGSTLPPAIVSDGS